MGECLVLSPSLPQLLIANNNSQGLEAEKEEGTTPHEQAVDNWFLIYDNTPAEQRPAFRKSLQIKEKKPELFTRLFATSDANHIAKESTDILSWLKEEVQRLESSSK